MTPAAPPIAAFNTSLRVGLSSNMCVAFAFSLGALSFRIHCGSPFRSGAERGASRFDFQAKIACFSRQIAGDARPLVRDSDGQRCVFQQPRGAEGAEGEV